MDARRRIAFARAAVRSSAGCVAAASAAVQVGEAVGHTVQASWASRQFFVLKVALATQAVLVCWAALAACVLTALAHTAEDRPKRQLLRQFANRNELAFLTRRRPTPSGF